MSRYARGLAVGALFALGIWLLALAGQVGAFDDIADAQKDVVKLAKSAAGGKIDAAQAKAIRKKYDDLEIIMTIYKPKNKKGLGFNKTPQGIELKIINLGKRALPKATLDKEANGLIEMAHINMAVADLTKLYVPAKPKGGKKPAGWLKYCDETKKAAQDLIKAVKSGDPAKVKSAATNLNSACNGCHSDFRDV
jgi:hypothetical protein